MPDSVRLVDQPLRLAADSTAVFIRDVTVAPDDMIPEGKKRALLLLAGQRLVAYLQKDEAECNRLHDEGAKAIAGLFPAEGE